jgi:phage/plasmid-associated DNA primase
MYRNYTAWADESRHKALTKTSFAKRLPKVMREYRPDLEQYRSGNVRGWRRIEDNKEVELL